MRKMVMLAAVGVAGTVLSLAVPAFAEANGGKISSVQYLRPQGYTYDASGNEHREQRRDA